MTSLVGKTAIITGASKGIGAATALALARAGANVVINYASDDAPANELVSTLTSGAQSKVPRALAVKADAGDIKELESMVNKVVEVYGKIDILIANAGIMPLQDLEHTTEEIYDRVMRLNVKGPFFLAQVCTFYLIWASTKCPTFHWIYRMYHVYDHVRFDSLKIVKV